MIIPTAPVTFGTRTIDSSFVYPTSVSPAPDMGIKSPTYFRPPPSPSPSHQDFHSVKSPPAGVMSRPSPAQSPVFGMSSLRTSSSFLSHHFNSNSNSADSHEVAALMSNSSNNSVPSGSLMVYPHSPDKSHRHSSGRDSAASRGSENSCPYPGGMGAFSSISNKDNICPSPSFSKTVLDNPDNLKRRLEERRKEAPNPTKFAQAMRDFFEKVNNGQTPERSKLTMLHFTFYNPPKPGGSDSGRKGKSRSSRASSVCSEMENSNKEIIVDDKKAASAPSSIASRRTTASSVGSGIGSGGSVVSVHDDCQSEAGSTASNNSSNVPGPRVKVGPDGQLIIDEQSLVVETSESQRARKQIEDMEVVSGADYAVGSSGSIENKQFVFYRALNQCGTDFSMMLSLFPNRSRQELKSKFKREDRKNPDMVSKALASCHFDPDEGISSDEDLALYYEDPLQGKAKKKKKEKVEFTAAQKKEFNLTNFKGAGTGKRKKWNSLLLG
ncbi:Transcription factor TFIIIB component B'' [Orchesella cincta]|uniref:Transcription factor TFIIIB component B n=1 Tax=Orchesella cincta TaxID=48709 RepID=A0A1D2MES1_ORCCI|nr:Transcription factor TFIIIB component B'' [Orchesella cincta]